MAGVQGSSQPQSQELPLPPSFQTIESILDFSAEKVKGQPIVNVIGVIKDYQPPMQTHGPDYKCTITVVDASTQYDDGIKAYIFGSLREMPHISNSGDVVILRSFKVQSRGGSSSLLTNHGSGINVFHVSNIPSWPCSNPESLPNPSFSLKIRPPSTAELTFITWLSNFIDKSGLPDEQTFQVRVQHAAVPKEKFSLLKDVNAGNYYDIIGEVVRTHVENNKATIYLSDYTANPLFYNNVRGGNSGRANSRDGDEYGYVKSKPKAASNWPGPHGKLSIQLTLWGRQGEVIEEENIKVGNWLYLKNVHVKIGNMGSCLEGVLHENRLEPNKLGVRVLPLSENRDSADPRLIDAIRRKKAYEKKSDKEEKRYLDEAAQESAENGKGESDWKEPARLNSKRRRKMMRETVQQKPATGEEKVEINLDLNINVRCNHTDKPTTPLSVILRNHEAVTPGTEHEYLLPFVNTKCRASVRVVDYWPHKLEDFSVGRRISAYDMLSDHSGGESTNGEENMRQFRDGNEYGEKTWEWRFALQVEQAGNKSNAEKLWMVVDNAAAQMLLYQDAVDLHHDKTALCNLREIMSTLWGDLEEQKSAFLDSLEGKALLKGDNSPPTPDPELPKRPYRKPSIPAEELPPDSDDETEKSNALNGQYTSIPAALADRDPNARTSQAPEDLQTQKPQTLSAAIWTLPITNKGFTCCIQQFGIKVAEDDETKADAGEMLRWQRMFGLFGTMIDRVEDD